MKKLKFLTLSALMLGFFINSCSNDDNDDHSGGNADLIVGTWKITDVWVGGQSVYALILLTNPCPLQSKFVCENDFSARVETVEEDTDTGDCVPGEVQTGSWSKEGSTYYISSEGQTVNSEVEFLDDNNFTLMYELEGETAKIKLTRQ